MPGPTPKNTRNVWLIDEGTGGHRVQSEGIIQVLQNQGIALETITIRSQLNLRGFLRSPARTLLALPGKKWPLSFVRRFCDFEFPVSPQPSFIISSGGRSAFLSRALSKHLGVPNVFVGLPHPFPSSWFTIVMPPGAYRGPTTIIPTGIIPNTVTPEECGAAADAYWPEGTSQNLWALLIGGSSRSHSFGEQDWRNLARGVKALSARYDIKWLISTSRRTGRDDETILKSMLNPACIAEAVWYSEEPKKIVKAFLGASQRVFVTQDSLTMLCEAMLSGRPVISLVPDLVRLSPGTVNNTVYNAIYTFDQVHKQPLSELSDYRSHMQEGQSTEQGRLELEKAALEMLRYVESGLTHT